MIEKVLHFDRARSFFKIGFQELRSFLGKIRALKNVMKFVSYGISVTQLTQSIMIFNINKPYYNSGDLTIHTTEFA